jgi:hypothetical protein
MKTQLINRSAMIGARFSDQSPGPLLVEDRFDAKSRSSRDPFSVFPVPAVRPGRASDAEQRAGLPHSDGMS